jgi:hypothetical protein
MKSGIVRAAHTPVCAKFGALVIMRVEAIHAAIMAKIAISAVVRASLAVAAASVRCLAGPLR